MKLVRLSYLRRLLTHKYYVWVAGRWLGVAWWQLFIHDASKFSRAEFMPYARYFPDRKPEHKADFKVAWRHHLENNPHHWDHWVLEDGWIRPMPAHFVREMLADWLGAGRAYTGKWDLTDWLANAGPGFKMHSDTKAMLRLMLARNGWHRKPGGGDWEYNKSTKLAADLGE